MVPKELKLEGGFSVVKFEQGGFSNGEVLRKGVFRVGVFREDVFVGRFLGAPLY